MNEPSFAEVTTAAFAALTTGAYNSPDAHERAAHLVQLANAIATNNQAKAQVGLADLWRLQ